LGAISNSGRPPIIHAGKNVGAVIFDMDGVIVDTRRAHIDSWIEWADSIGKPINAEDFMRRTFGRGNMEILPEFFPDHAEDAAFLSQKSRDKESIFVRRMHGGEVAMVPGLMEFLHTLRGHATPVALGSSAPRMNIVATLDTFGLHDFFPVIVSMEDVSRAKPDPEIFLKCCAGLGVDPATAVVLEDSIYGLDAARAAGCSSVGFTTMHTEEELGAHTGECVPDFHGLMELWALTSKVPKG